MRIFAFSADRLLLRCASLLVPGDQRGEWMAEWRAELWYASRGPHATAFCVGAFHDAAWLRGQSLRKGALRMESARQCGFVLGLLLGVSLLVAMRIPGARQALLPRPAGPADGVVLISRDGSTDPSAPSISAAEYSSWVRRRQGVFQTFGFYRLVAMRDSQSVVADRSVFDLLRLPLPSSALIQAQTQHRAAYVLGRTAWRRDFNSDAAVVGRHIERAGRSATIVAIEPEGAWQPSTRLDGWLLEEDTAHAPEALGFVLAQTANPPALARTTGNPHGGRWHIDIASGGSSTGFSCEPLDNREQSPFVTFLFTLMLACLALPATTPLPLGEYPATGHPHSTATRLRRWAFLLMKLGLSVPLVYLLSLILAFADSSASANACEYVQFASSFTGLLFCFRWAWRDQRRRCPVCLRVLSHPARVGHASRNFLAWHGTEFLCGEGHGLLHVPEIATTWFSTQRWLYLDPSWKGLFPKVYLPPA